MAPIIIPAVLPKTISELENSLKKIKSFSEFVQVDIADGIFVENKTVDLKEIVSQKNYFKDFFLEIHLMVKNSVDYFLDCQKIGVQRVIFHYEAFDNTKDLLETINQGKKFDFEIGIAINPSTSIDDLEILKDKINFFLFMSVNPGKQGQQFIPEVLEKIKKFREKYPEKKIEIDGGINNSNIIKVVKAGVDYLVVGSFIIKDKKPKEKFFSLQKLI